MAIASEKYIAVTAELERMWQYMTTLAIEIEETAPLAERRGFSWFAAIQTESAITLLQRRLREDQERHRLHNQLRGR